MESSPRKKKKSRLTFCSRPWGVQGKKKKGFQVQLLQTKGESVPNGLKGKKDSSQGVKRSGKFKKGPGSIERGSSGPGQKKKITEGGGGD